MPFYNFGLEGIVGLALYLSGWVAVLLSLFWRPRLGVYYLIPLIPLQTIRYRMNTYPLGESMVSLIILAVAFGSLRKRETVFRGTPWGKVIGIYCLYTFLSFIFGIFYLDGSLSSFSDTVRSAVTAYRFSDWRGYMLMPLLLFLVYSTMTSKRQIQICLLAMALSIVVVDKGIWSTLKDRDYSSYSNDMRNDAGSLGQAGSNGLGAFEAQSAAMFLVLGGAEKKKRLRFFYLFVAGFSALCLMYSFSRGGYAAFLVTWLVIGIVQQRKLLLILFVFILIWASVVPPAVRDRVSMTDDDGSLDHSSETRVRLWEDAFQLISSNPIIGTGYNTYAFMGRIGNYRDTHDIYIKVMVEGGIIGLGLFLFLLFGLIRGGFRLFRTADDPLLSMIGLALVVWTICSAVANIFGDRWTFLQVNGYMWVLGGLTARGLIIQETGSENEELPASGEIEMDQLSGSGSAQAAIA